MCEKSGGAFGGDGRRRDGPPEHSRAAQALLVRHALQRYAPKPLSSVCVCVCVCVCVFSLLNLLVVMLLSSALFE